MSPDAPAPKRMPPWWIPALLVFPLIGAIWFGVVSSDPLPIDVFWRETVLTSPGTVPFALAHALHIVGNTPNMAIISTVLTVAFALFRLWRHALTTALTMLSVLAVIRLTKLLVDRPRPLDMLVEQHETSFPSGHVLAGAALMTLIAVMITYSGRVPGWVTRLVTGAAIAYIVTMMWSRTALGVHWLTDTVAGALIGVALALMWGQWLLPRQAPSYPQREPAVTKQSDGRPTM